MSRLLFAELQRVVLSFSFLFLASCGGGQNGSSDQDLSSQAVPQSFIAGGGVKGPLAFANVELYALDARFEELYDPGNPVAVATTDAYAQISGLAVPASISPPYVLVIDGTNAIDRNTNEAPVIKKLVTIITREFLAAGRPVYATPYTTLAYHMLRLRSHGDGLKATYYNDLSFSKVALERIDSTINHNWGSGSPASSVNSDHFSVRWEGMIQPEHSGNYTFYTSTDDGVRLWVNGVLLFDRWADQSATEYSGSIRLTGGEKYSIVMEYYENGGEASARLSWSGPEVPKTVVPQVYLYSGDGADVRMTDRAIASNLAEFDQKIVQAIGFGIPPDISIFATPPILSSYTTSVESQQRVVELRAAIEAFSALVHEMSLASQPSVTADILLKRLALDLYSDDRIDSSANHQSVGGIDTAILTQNPMGVTIPNTGYEVRDIILLIDEERALAGDSGNVVFYRDDVVIDLRPASLYAEPASAQNANSNNITVTNLVNTLLASGLVASGPIVINGERDTVISGLHITNPNGHCIEIKNGASNIVIENSEIGPCGKKGIDISNSSNHITIRNNYIHDIQNEAVMSNNSHDIAVDSNVIVNVESGYEMWGTTVGNLSFTNNYVKNVARREGSLNGGNIAMAAFVYAGGIRINNNIGINILGESYPADLINIFKSSGKPDDPIQIKNNRLKGGGPMPSGGGIIVGDQGGSYQLVEDNILVNPGQYGLALVGGHDNVIRNNKVFSDDQRDFTNIGLFVFRYNTKDDGTPPGQCYRNTVEYNDITWSKGPNYKNNGLPASLDPAYKPDFGADGVSPNCGTVAGWNTNRLDTQGSRPADLDISIWDTAWDNP